MRRRSRRWRPTSIASSVFSPNASRQSSTQPLLRLDHPPPGACKYVLNTLMQVFQEPALASAVGEANERMIVAALLERLLDAAVPRMEEGPQLVKALNVLMLKVLEHCPRTSSFRALLRLLATPPESVADDEATTARFNELVVKCLIKLTKALEATLHEVRLPELLQEIHAYFDALGTEEIRRRGRASDGGDKPFAW